MFEEYLEDCVYKFLANMSSRVRGIFGRNNTNTDEPVPTTPALPESAPVEASSSQQAAPVDKKSKKHLNEAKDGSSRSDNADDSNRNEQNQEDESQIDDDDIDDDEVDDELNNLNFHMIMFFLWMTVTIVNIPALLTWARNFKYSMILKPDSSYYPGLTLSICSIILWQNEGPRKNLRLYESAGTILFAMAIFIMVIGPFTLAVVSYGVSYVIAMLTLQQFWDEEEVIIVSAPAGGGGNDNAQSTESKGGVQRAKDKGPVQASRPKTYAEAARGTGNVHTENPTENIGTKKNRDKPKDQTPKDSEKRYNKKQPNEQQPGNTEQTVVNSDVPDESNIYSMFRNLKERFGFANDA